jgi:hypothetical protein
VTAVQARANLADMAFRCRADGQRIRFLRLLEIGLIMEWIPGPSADDPAWARAFGILSDPGLAARVTDDPLAAALKLRLAIGEPDSGQHAVAAESEIVALIGPQLLEYLAFEEYVNGALLPAASHLLEAHGAQIDELFADPRRLAAEAIAPPEERRPVGEAGLAVIALVEATLAAERFVVQPFAPMVSSVLWWGIADLVDTVRPAADAVFRAALRIASWQIESPDAAGLEDVVPLTSIVGQVHHPSRAAPLLKWLGRGGEVKELDPAAVPELLEDLRNYAPPEPEVMELWEALGESEPPKVPDPAELAEYWKREREAREEKFRIGKMPDENDKEKPYKRRPPDAER